MDVGKPHIMYRRPGLEILSSSRQELGCRIDAEVRLQNSKSLGRDAGRRACVDGIRLGRRAPRTGL